MSDNLFKPEDLIVKSWSSKNKGSRSTVEDNGIFIYHKPTQTEYKCDSERSQHINRRICFGQLKEYLRKCRLEHKKLTKLKQRSKRKSISKSKFERLMNNKNSDYVFQELENHNEFIFCRNGNYKYYFDSKRKLYFRDVLQNVL